MVLKHEKNKQTPDIDGQIPTPKCFRSAMAMAMAISLEDFLVGQSRDYWIFVYERQGGAPKRYVSMGLHI